MKWVYADETTRLTNQQWMLFEYPGESGHASLSSQFARRPCSTPLYGDSSAYYRDVVNEARNPPMHHLALSSDGPAVRQPSEYELDLHDVTVNWKCACSEGQSPHGRLNIARSLDHRSFERNSHPWIFALIAE